MHTELDSGPFNTLGFLVGEQRISRCRTAEIKVSFTHVFTVFVFLQAKSQFKRRSTANNVEIHIPVPADADSPKFKVWMPYTSSYCRLIHTRYTFWSDYDIVMTTITSLRSFVKIYQCQKLLIPSTGLKCQSSPTLRGREMMDILTLVPFMH